MQTHTTDSTTQTQAGAQNAREKINVDGIAFPDLFEQDENSAAPEIETPNPDAVAESNSSDPSDAPLPVVDPGLMHNFKIKVSAIKLIGESLPARVEEFAKTSVIGDLANIVGVLNEFFVGGSEQQIETFKDELFKQVDIKYNSNTSEYHLLSRIYRSANRRKASADAKVLKAALDAGITQAEFPDWVKREGGYDKIVKSNSKNSTKGSRKPKKVDPKVLWGQASERINALIENGQMSNPFSFDESEWPELCNKLRPDSENDCSVVLVNIKDGKIHFRKLESYEPFTPAYEHKHFDGVRVQHVVNVDGTSADTWPEFMVEKSDGAKKSIEESESTDQAAD